MNEKTSVVFRRICLEDKELIFRWISDSELRKMIGTRGTPNAKTHDIWFEAKLSDRKNEIFVIENNNKPIGIIGTNQIDMLNLNAEMHLYIGEKKERGKGIASVAVQNFVNYITAKYNLHKVTARIFSFNKPSIKLFEKCGFILEGIQKEQVLCSEEDVYADLLWYAIITNKRC